MSVLRNPAAPLYVEVIPVTPFAQNCSIVVCNQTRQAALIDPGGDVAKITARVHELGVQVTHILLTHGHIDHCADAPVFAQALGSADQPLPIIGPHAGDDYWLADLPVRCQAYGFGAGQAFTPTRWLQDGDTVTVGAQTLDVLHCPGHTPGHVVFVHAGMGLAWVGDVLFAGSIGRTDFPGGNHADLLAAIANQLLPLGDDVQFISGHGPMSDLGHERQFNPYLRDLS